jgi:phosphoribosylaminoimidazole-succinocarboxamide synthase
MPEAVAGLPLLYSGSVKDVYGKAGADPYIFVFSDRYSIFDWGEMPDALSGKGEALAVVGDLFFRQLEKGWDGWEPAGLPGSWGARLLASPTAERLRKEGLNHHSLGLVNSARQPLPPGSPSRCLAVRALERPAVSSSTQGGKVHWDYSAYASRPSHCLVPLEVVFRFGAPEGSSFLERLKSVPGYSKSFGFTADPRAGEKFPYPVVELFTKLEPTDRYLSRTEAQTLAALTEEELDELEQLTLLLALRLRDLFASQGLDLWDGKFEFAYLPGKGRRHFQLVDSIGPDELRLLGPGGVHFSKEFLRRAYRGSPWFEALGKAKREAKERGVKDWKKICREELGQAPAPLPPKALAVAQKLYPVLAEGLAKEFLGRSLYPGLPSVPELCRELEAAL